MDKELLDLLSRIDTPTVCNAIEVVQGKRGFRGFTRGTVVSTEAGSAVQHEPPAGETKSRPRIRRALGLTCKKQKCAPSRH